MCVRCSVLLLLFFYFFMFCFTFCSARNGTHVHLLLISKITQKINLLQLNVSDPIFSEPSSFSGVFIIVGLCGNCCTCSLFFFLSFSLIQSNSFTFQFSAIPFDRVCAVRAVCLDYKIEMHNFSLLKYTIISCRASIVAEWKFSMRLQLSGTVKISKTYVILFSLRVI